MRDAAPDFARLGAPLQRRGRRRPGVAGCPGPARRLNDEQMAELTALVVAGPNPDTDVWARLRDVESAIADPASLWKRLGELLLAEDTATNPEMDIIVRQARRLLPTLELLDRAPRRILRRTHRMIPLSSSSIGMPWRSTRAASWRSSAHCSGRAQLCRNEYATRPISGYGMGHCVSQDFAGLYCCSSWVMSDDSPIFEPPSLPPTASRPNIRRAHLAHSIRLRF